MIYSEKTVKKYNLVELVKVGQRYLHHRLVLQIQKIVLIRNSGVDDLILKLYVIIYIYICDECLSDSLFNQIKR